MSNHLAFASVTLALRQKLKGAFADQSEEPDITIVRPDGSGGTLPTYGVNLYLFQANVSGNLGNIDLPTRRSDGSVIQPPVAVVELIYLLTFHGSEVGLQPQILQASVMRHLHSRPVLTRSELSELAIDLDSIADVIGKSGIADQNLAMTITPYQLSLEDTSKVWSVFFQTNYILTSAIRVAYIQLDADELSQESLPVRQPVINVAPFSSLNIDSIDPERIELLTGSEVTIRGSGLNDGSKQYLVDDLPAEPTGVVSNSAVTIPLPAGCLAGMRQVRVMGELIPGSGRYVIGSNSVMLEVQPVIDSTEVFEDSTGSETVWKVRLQAAHAIDYSQQAELLLNGYGATANTGFGSFVLTDAERESLGTDAEGNPVESPDDPIVFELTDVPSGDYLMRLRVDGANSVLTVDTTDPNPLNQPYTGPLLSIT